MGNHDIRNAIKKNCEERDKNINGFQIPFVADNNEDYEKKLKEKLSAFKKEINRPAFEKEGNLIADVRDICDKVSYEDHYTPYSVSKFVFSKLANYMIVMYVFLVQSSRIP